MCDALTNRCFFCRCDALRSISADRNRTAETKTTVAAKRLAPVQPKDRNVNFVRSRSGQRFLMLDQWRYFKDSENTMLVFWKCHELHKSNCPAEVATTKNEANSRVVVINDTHIHKRKRKEEADATVVAATTAVSKQSKAPEATGKTVANSKPT